MKLATLRNGRPDGQLIVLSSDLARYASAGRIAPTLQAALDAWDAAAPALEELARRLDSGDIAASPFDPALATAPLPRAYQRIAGSAYGSHEERLPTRGVTWPAETAARRPFVAQAFSDWLAGPSQLIELPSTDSSADLSAEVAVVVGAVPARPTREQALAAIRLVLLCNTLVLRRLLDEPQTPDPTGFQARPLAAFAPAAVTPKGLGAAWRQGRLVGPVRVTINDMLFGQPDAGTDMQFDFADLIVAAAQHRPLGSGTIVASGTVSNRHDETPPVRREGIGFASIGEARTLELAKYGRARTPYLKPGDRVRITALDAGERPIFGTIDQLVGGPTKS